MPVVSITRLRVRSLRFMPVFFLRVFQSAWQAAKSEGNLAVTLLRDRSKTFWTATSWSNEGAIMRFMHAGVHGPVMRRLLEWCDEASVVRWTQDSPELPSWGQAYLRLQKEGRTSKVNHASFAHAAFEILQPAAGLMREVRIRKFRAR